MCSYNSTRFLSKEIKYFLKYKDNQLATNTQSFEQIKANALDINKYISTITTH